MSLANYLTCLFSLLPVFAQATQYAPWYGIDKLIECRTIFAYQHANRLDIDGSHFGYHADNRFLDLSGMLTADPAWCLEAEILQAGTHEHDWGFDCGRITGRHLFMNDINGDYPVSLSFGISVTGVSKNALYDFNIMHHGYAEYETHLAVGKEFICGEFWTSRVWAVSGIGIANRGSPWMFARVEYERNQCNLIQYGVFLNGLYGFGNHQLNPFDFQGYGSVRHRAWEIGARLAYEIEWVGNVSIEYNWRFFARNTLANCHTFTASVMLPHRI